MLTLLMHASAQSDKKDSTTFVLQSDAEAKQAVFYIVRYSGLTPNFTVVEDREIKNAKAYIKSKSRVVAYNPQFIKDVLDSSKTNWSAISILAHEVGHHLLGHTLKNSSSPGDELAADQYSGYVLYQMGATLQEALSAIEVAVLTQEGGHHPPKELRKKAIEAGWKDGEYLVKNKVNPNQISSEKDYKMKLQFDGDNNQYYVDENNRIIWYNNFGTAIRIGDLKESDGNRFVWEYIYNNSMYGIDRHGHIWNADSQDHCFMVGNAYDLKK